MNQVLNIFAKDLRRLWPQVAVLFLLISLHVFLDVKSTPQGLQPESRYNAPASAITLVLPLGIWLLVALLVFQESLVGDKQFWITRPYRWTTLLLAKILFLLAFFNLPMLISDCCILVAQGFPVITVVPQLLLRQVHMTVVFVVPAFAIATISASIAQFVMFSVGAVLTAVMSSMLLNWLISPGGTTTGIAFDSFDEWTILVLLVAIVLFQYATRSTAKARVALFTVFLFIEPIAAFSPLRFIRKRVDPVLESNSSNPGVTIEYDLAGSVRARAGESPMRPDFISIQIPLKVSGIPPGSLLRGSGQSRLKRNGKAVLAGRLVDFIASIDRISDCYVQAQTIDRSAFEFLSNNLTDLETSFDLELVNDRSRFEVPVTALQYIVPQVGRCQTFQDHESVQVSCRNGLEPGLETSLSVRSQSRLESNVASFDHVDVPWGLSPTNEAGRSKAISVTADSIFQFIPRVKLASFHRTLRFANLVPHLAPVDAQQEK